MARSDRRHRVNPNAIIDVSMWALLRSVVLDIGRTQRLFTGAARTAVMLLEEVCIWPGCEHPHNSCHADHIHSWSQRGPTNPGNGAPRWARHNHLEELGFTITRDPNGNWHLTAPDGTIIS